MRPFILTTLMLAPIAAVMLWPTSVGAAVGIVFLSHMLVLYPTLSPNSLWLGPVITTFATDAKEVWLTIDDGPTDDTSEVLDILDRYGAPATFFTKGELASRRPDLLATIRDRGHQVANHSNTHPSATFWCAGPSSIRREISQANEAIGGSRLFRAPVGHKNPFVHPVLEDLGMELVGWSARGWDTVSEPESAAKRILDAIRPGSIILLHQGPGAADRAQPARCLELVLVGLVERGYRAIIPHQSQLRG